jgi:hypothetical protein
MPPLPTGGGRWLGAAGVVGDYLVVATGSNTSSFSLRDDDRNAAAAPPPPAPLARLPGYRLLLDSSGAAPPGAKVRKPSLSPSFYTKSDHFTKTGSGQTEGKQHSKTRPFSRSGNPSPRSQAGAWTALTTVWLTASSTFSVAGVRVPQAWPHGRSSSRLTPPFRT